LGCSLISYITKWSQPFASHFVDDIHLNVSHLGAWMLRPYGLETATTNQSEAFNHVLKRLQDWKEAPIDSLVLSLFRLARFHIAEVRRGRCGQGDYILREGIEATSSETVPSVVPPQPTEIVESIRYGNNGTVNEPVPSTSSPPTNDDIEPST